MAAIQSPILFSRITESVLDKINRWYLLAILHSTGQMNADRNACGITPEWSEFIQAQNKSFPTAHWWGKRCGCMATDALQVCNGNQTTYRAIYRRLMLDEISKVPREHRVKALQIACIWF